MKNLPNKLRSFLILIYILTIGSLIAFLLSSSINKELINLDILFFILLISVTESCNVVFNKISFSTSFAVEIAAYILFGPLATLIIIVVGFALRIAKVDDYKYQHIFNTPFFVTIFNFCVLTVSLLSGHYFYLLSGGSFGVNNLNSNNLISLILYTVSVCVVNNIIISLLGSILSGKSFRYCFKDNMLLFLINILVLAPLGIILVFVYEKYTYLGVIVVLLPILLSRYAFSLYVRAKSQCFEVVDALMRAMEARDKYTEGHSQRVAGLVEKIAREMKCSETDIEHLKIASMLHDVGKMGIDDNILNKPGRLTEEEFNAIKQHPVIGLNILKDIKNLSDVKEIVLHHHERYDGKGYPDGKSAKDLSLDVFIVQLADSVDAMATDRPYRKALSMEDIVQELERNRGTQFHPKVVDAYLKIMEKEK